MLTRSTRSMVTFSNAFTFPGNAVTFPPGTYEIVAVEELLQGLSFEAYRRTATYLLVHETAGKAGQMTMHMTTQKDLDHAIACDRALSDTTQHGEAAPSPLEDTT